MDIAGRVAVVTGAASGIGLGLAERFLAEGMSVVMADVERDALDREARRIDAGSGRVRAVPCDVGDPDQVARLRDEAVAAFGAVHVLCNNAGVAGGRPLLKTRPALWRWVVDVNLLGVAYGVQAFGPLMVQQGMGHIVNTASEAGLIPAPLVGAYCATKYMARGPQAIGERIAVLRADGVGVAIVDATSNDDLLRLGPALKGMPLVTAGSGVAISLPANWGLVPSSTASQLPPAQGLRAIVSGSCSQATRRQVAHFKAQGGAALALDPLQLTGDTEPVVAKVMAWAQPLLSQGPVLVYSTAEPEAVKAIQTRLGAATAGVLVEHALAAVARALVQAGVQQLVVAGGETSGACVQALGITQLQIGPQIDPGVPWCHARGDAGPLHLTLKSGNFGTEDFFTKAWAGLA
ncbi:MAG: SDR family NAD(P)-dependent oxidoreductase [Alphaproteobacteria bacterium]